MSVEDRIKDVFDIIADHFESEDEVRMWTNGKGRGGVLRHAA